jgi:hypothetical protein
MMADQFETSRDTYFRSLPNFHYIFEMTKCCNHFEWITVLKTATTTELYKYVRDYLTVANVKIYVKDIYGNRLEVTETNCTLNYMIPTNPSFFRPVYGLPHPVVYKLYIDDGHRCHNEMI